MSKEYPEEYLYTKDHEWARRDGKLVTVGVSKFAVDQLGDITQVDLPREGETVTRETVCGSIESVKAVSDLFAPVSGKVVKVNDPLKDSPEYVNQDCYDEGWMVIIEMSDEGELAKLMPQPQYLEYLKEHG